MNIIFACFLAATVFSYAKAKEKCTNGKYYPHPGSINKYYQCAHENLVEFSCHPCLKWSQQYLTCVDNLNGCPPKNEFSENEIDSKLKQTSSEETRPSTSQRSDDTTQPRRPVQISKSKLQKTRPRPHVSSSSSSASDEETPKGQQSASGQDDEFKVICYFTNSASYRTGTAKFLPNDIDPALCSHVIYSFALLDGFSNEIKISDTWNDIDNRFYEKVTALKRNGVKVTIAIGGWNDSAGDKYSKLVNSKAKRAKFITHVVEFIKSHNFDGLDLDWEYPKCWQGNCGAGPDSDKKAFADFVSELRDAFDPHGLLLSAAIGQSKLKIDKGYDVPTLSAKLDWIGVMTYDFHVSNEVKTGHVAPLYEHKDDSDKTLNSDFIMKYLIKQGADPKKLVLGIPTYGQSFTLSDSSNNGLNAPASGSGKAGEGTQSNGILSYYEICDRVTNKGWKVVTDETGSMGPYAISGNQWVSFDDAPMIKKKSQYVKKNGFGGAMIWTVDFDDFKNVCNCEKYPLLKAINRVLRNYPDGQVCSLTERN